MDLIRGMASIEWGLYNIDLIRGMASIEGDFTI
jgi:hypothetical protein